MKKIMVIGVSAGAGKSTLAKKLAEKLAIPVYHLDTLYWKPGWVESDIDEFWNAQEEIVQQSKWIIEGNYSSTFDLRFAHADTIVYVEKPLLTCLYRVVKRRIQNHGRTRSDMTLGCEEKIDWQFIKFILTTYHRRKKKMAERCERFKDMKQVITVRNNREIEALLERLG
ncbi:topology modulation protein [Robertmurraya massiliosenegalensis]|uniref:topology modulation protein n=1 Tax=Robertmurraya TaxID=2837507 RepID=UPI0039A717E9